MSRFFKEEDQLSDDEEITVGDLKLDDFDSNDDTDDPVGLPGYMEDRMSDDDLETFKSTGKESEGKILDEGDLEEYGALVTDEDMERARGPIQPDEPAPDEQISASAVDLGTMGSDTSDHQNDYDPKEIELLMKLMASEADAMNEYLQGAKDTNIDVLRRLFADIGNEERFHMEQLLYAKCELTGEKYEPKDPDVKSEYEELLKMGMDEETAMQTAVDRCHIRGSISIEETNDEAVDLKGDTETLEQYAHNVGFMIDQFLEAVDDTSFDPDKYEKANDTFLECFIVAEGAYIGNDNGADAGNGGLNVKKHPLRAIHRVIGTLLDLIQRLINKIKQLVTNLKNRSREIKRFLKRYSLAGVFKDGIRMYFYDLDNPAEVNNALDQWLALACDVVQAASKQVGISVSLMAHPERVQRSPRLMINGSVDKGITLLNQVQLTKSKSLFPEDKAKQEMIADCLFGYKTEKGPDAKSDNVLNTLNRAADSWTFVLKATNQLAEALDGMANNQNSPYYRKRAKYDQSVKALEAVVKTCKAVINGISSDIATISSLNVALIEAVNKHDHDDINANPQLQDRAQRYGRFQQMLN